MHVIKLSNQQLCQHLWLKGRGMNAAFAIGRLCDLEAGRSRLLGLLESERMVFYSYVKFNMAREIFRAKWD